MELERLAEELDELGLLDKTNWENFEEVITESTAEPDYYDNGERTEDDGEIITERAEDDEIELLPNDINKRIKEWDIFMTEVQNRQLAMLELESKKLMTEMRAEWHKFMSDIMMEYRKNLQSVYKQVMSEVTQSN